MLVILRVTVAAVSLLATTKVIAVVAFGVGAFCCRPWVMVVCQQQGNSSFLVSSGIVAAGLGLWVRIAICLSVCVSTVDCEAVLGCDW